MTLIPPMYRFALFGLRRSGKSVFLASLDADRRPLSDGTTISYVDTDPPELVGKSGLDRESLRQRAKQKFLENAKGLNQKRVPAETETAEGVTTHRFTITLPKPPAPGASRIIQVEILDYAGELLKPLSDEKATQELLHQVLCETDGLIILAETPPASSGFLSEAITVQPLRELASALNTLHVHDPSALRCAMLLATKWDRQYPFDVFRGADEKEGEFQKRLKSEEASHFEKFTKWLEDAPEANRLRELNNKLQASFEPEDYSVWPTSAFGVSTTVESSADDGKPIEISANRELNSLNLVEPILFLVDRVRQQHRVRLENLHVGATFEPSDLPSEDDLLSEHGDDETLKSHVRALFIEAVSENKVRQARKIKLWTLSVFAASLIVVLLSSFSIWKRQDTKVAELRRSVNDAAEAGTLQSIIQTYNFLISDDASQTPLLGPTLSSEERLKYLKQLEKRECELWERSAGQDILDVELAKERQVTLPKCKGLDLALSKEEERVWRLDVQNARIDLGRIATSENCNVLSFNRSALDEALKSLLERLSLRPETLLLQSETFANEARQMHKDCLSAWDQAVVNNKLLKAEKALKSKLSAARRKLDREDWRNFATDLVSILDAPEFKNIDRSKLLSGVGTELENLEIALKSWNVSVKSSVLDNDIFEMDVLIRNIDSIKGNHPDLANYIDPLRSVIVSTKERLREATVCEIGQYLVEQYKKMQTDLAARNPVTKDKFIEKLNQAGQEDALQSLWRQLEPLVKNKIPVASVTSISIKGNLPVSDRRDDDIRGALIINGRQFTINWTEAKKEDGFLLTKKIYREINVDNENKIEVRLELDKIFGKTRLGGEISLDTDKLFASMKLDGKLSRSRSLEFSVPIAVDNDAKSLEKIDIFPGPGAHKIIVQMQVSPSSLPELKDLPQCLLD